MNISLLHPFEAVKSGNVLIVQFPSDGYNIRYVVDGKELPSTYNRQIAIDSGSVLQKYTPASKTLLKVICEDGTEYSADEYRTTQNKYDEDDYPSLEVEFEHRKLLQKLSSGNFVYEETEIKYEPVDIKIVGELTDTGSEYITTPLVLSKARFSNYDNSFYKVDVTGVIGDTLGKFIKENDLKLEVPTHSGFKWAKVNGNYVFTDEEFENMADNGILFHQTLEKAKECESLWRDKVYKHLSTKFSTKRVEGLMVSEVYSELTSILNLLYDCVPSKKSESKLSATRSKIKKLQQLLMENN